jgi:hypothetical protein
MAKYTSKYLSLSFYVNGRREQFIAGTYETEDSETIAVLQKTTDVHRVDEMQEEPKAEEAPKPKKAPKASGK